MKYKYSGAVVSSLCMSTRTDEHFHPECKRSQQDLQLTETNILPLLTFWACKLPRCTDAPLKTLFLCIVHVVYKLLRKVIC